MRKGFLIFAAALFASFAAHAQSLGASDQTAIRRTIERQIDAFRADDGPAAFAFADTTIQQMFGGPERFMAMVREGYKMIYRPRSYVFGPAAEAGELVAQIVEFDGQDGSAGVALYHMARQSDGTWRIAGVEILPAKRPGV
jgi:ketosteroid isomerase-like protein